MVNCSQTKQGRDAEVTFLESKKILIGGNCSILIESKKSWQVPVVDALPNNTVMLEEIVLNVTVTASVLF